MAGVAEMMVSSVTKQVAVKVGELASEEIKRQWSFNEDVEEMKHDMDKLTAVLRDADSRSRKRNRDGEVVRLWLRKVKSVAYDIDDVLDELDANALIQTHAQWSWKARLFFSSHNPLLFRLNMAHKMKKVREELKKIWKEQKTNLNLDPDVVLTNESASEESFAPINCDIGMVGRKTEKEKIMRLLSQTEGEEDISIIPIVGLPGLGKTTLAQAVYADNRTSFDVRAWVDVSNFDLKRIGAAIISRVHQNINFDKCDLELIRSELRKVLYARRYLIVLDNLWEDKGDNLEKLKQMLQYGTKGSKTIVTTRMESVLLALHAGVLSHQRKICLVDPIRLELLSSDDCWTMIQQRAFGPEDDQNDLEGVGREIAHKCGGIPLVANALGYIMSQEKTIQAWTNIRDDAVLDLKENNENTILDRLMLSYYYMLPHIKLCFAYCMVFPYSFTVDSNHLIQQWSALGYIKAKDGKRCINYLLGMSFLHISKSSLITAGHGQAARKLSMHDLVHDLARKVAAHESFVLDAMAPSKTETYYCRYAQLVKCRNQPKILNELPSKVRSLHFRECLRKQLPKNAFSRFRYLRVLDLSGCSIVDQPTPKDIVLPSSISQLKLLRYLDASGLPIATLSKSFHTLQNMQTLILSNSSNLHKLPTSFGDLLNLSFLDLSGCCKLKELPKSVHKLTCLLHLDMSGCCALQNLPEQFGSLSKLEFLDLSGCLQLANLPENLHLEALEHLDLSGCHMLGNLPESFGNLCKLLVLNLSECYKFQMLPESLCQLKILKDLDLSDCHELKELPECLGNLCSLQSLKLTSCSKLQGLPESFGKLVKLKYLDLSFCIKLEKLPDSFGELRLESLNLNFCMELDNLPAAGLRNMISLSYLIALSSALRDEIVPRPTVHFVREIDGELCGSSIVELEEMTSNFVLFIKNLEKVKYPEEAQRAKLRNKSGLRLLSLEWVPESNGVENTAGREKDKLVLESLVPPSTVEFFRLGGYMSRGFPKWMSDISLFLPCLALLSLSDLTTCDHLPPFAQLPNLRVLSLRKMPKIRRISKELYGERGTCQKLRVVEVTALENLEEWWTTRSADENEEFLIPNLHWLGIRNCPKFKFLPYPPRSIFWYLKNAGEVLPARGFGRLSSFTSPYYMTISGCNFSSHKWDRLQHFSSLNYLWIHNCRGLTTLPQAVECLTSLKQLKLEDCADLELLPQWLKNLVSLEKITIRNCSRLVSVPESIQNLVTWEW